MSECEHEWVFDSIGSVSKAKDYGNIVIVEVEAYYYCRKCLATRMQVFYEAIKVPLKL